MATPALTYPDIVKQIRQGRPAPVYLLHGEEAYYIDRLVGMFEQLVPEEARDFNLYNLYAPEVTPDAIMDTCRRYPMMSDRVVVIVKEAQAVSGNELNKLHFYASRPNESTVLVISVRGSKAKAAQLVSEIKAHGGVIFESKKLTEKTVMPVISGLIKSKGLHVEEKGLAMLRDFIGTDVARLYNEIEKLASILGPGATVTPEAIERNVGISKDYNNFELVDAIRNRDAAKAFKCVAYFRSNPKKNPSVVTVAALFSFFSNLLIYQFSRGSSPRDIMAALGLKSEWQLKNYDAAARMYNAYQTIEIISAIRETDARSKGIGSRMDEYDLLYDLVYRILTARGNITF